MVVTGDGEALMNVVTLATVGVLNPPDISIIYDERALRRDRLAGEPYWLHCRYRKDGERQTNPKTSEPS